MSDNDLAKRAADLCWVLRRTGISDASEEKIAEALRIERELGRREALVHAAELCEQERDRLQEKADTLSKTAAEECDYGGLAAQLAFRERIRARELWDAASWIRAVDPKTLGSDKNES